MRETVLVTGAAGFAGSHLLDTLVGDCHVVAWRRPASTPPPDRRAAWTGVDLLDRSAVFEAVAAVKPDVVYHCAGAPHVGLSWNDAASALAVNVRGTHHLLEGIRRHRAGARVLICGSAMVYQPANEALTESHPLVPASPYGVTKLAQELLALRAIADGLDIRVARAFNHMGPRQKSLFAAAAFASQIAEIEAGRAAPVLSVGNLDARRDLTDVRDTVRAYRAIAETGQTGRPYNVCTGRAIAVRELLDMLLSRSRVPIEVTLDPKRLRPNDLPLLLGDPARIRIELGWTPAISLEQSIDDLLDYWRARSSAGS
jgi:GDP-4-dehydro-6-deoxy-D-mannose reductase